MARRTVNIERERERLEQELHTARKLVNDSWRSSIGTTSLRKLESGLIEVRDRVMKRLRALRRLERARERTDRKYAHLEAVRGVA